MSERRVNSSPLALCIELLFFSVLVAVMSVIILLLLDQPVLNSGGLVRGTSGLLALDLDCHRLVLLQARGEIGLFGGLGGSGEVEGGDLADGVRLLDGGGLVGLELLEIEFLNEVRCTTKINWLASASECQMDHCKTGSTVLPV